MAEITAEMVRALRDKTDLPMMECKKALTEANGDEQAAIKILKEKAKNVRVKTADRVTSNGRVVTLCKDDGSLGVMVEVRCETEPVAKNDDFVFFSDQLAKQLLNGPGAATPEELLAQEAPDRPGVKLADIFDEVLNKIRENIVVARVLRLPGPIAGYSHHNGSLGVLVQVSGANAKSEVIRDVAMHIAALNPKVTHPHELNPAEVEAERGRQLEDAKKSGKPEAIWEKIVSGKMRIWYANEGVLVEQPFAKDDTKTVAQALAAAGLTAVGFTRWRLGQA